MGTAATKKGRPPDPSGGRPSRGQCIRAGPLCSSQAPSVGWEANGLQPPAAPLARSALLADCQSLDPIHSVVAYRGPSMARVSTAGRLKPGPFSCEPGAARAGIGSCRSRLFGYKWVENQRDNPTLPTGLAGWAAVNPCRAQREQRVTPLSRRTGPGGQDPPNHRRECSCRSGMMVVPFLNPCSDRPGRSSDHYNGTG